jgi:hypothetical protein
MRDDPTSSAGPYVGPRPFEAGQPIYGRDRELVELLELLIAQRIVLFYSPSGAGKTSLIQAALIPALEEEGFRVRPIVRVGLEATSGVERASESANRYMLSSLLSLERGEAEPGAPLRAEIAHLDLSAYLKAVRPNDGEASLEVLIFDQFEEILTADPTDHDAKQQFFSQLGAALRDRRRWALFSIREDYIASLDPYLRLIPDELRARFRLDLLETRAARRAVQMPACSAGVDFTDAAADKLVEDLCRVRVQRADGTIVEQPGRYVEPVQLQLVCLRLWQRRPSGKDSIEATDIDDVGDVDAALAAYYADRVAELATWTGVRERTIREWIERYLISSLGMRGQVLQEPGHSQGMDNRVIQGLEAAHLLRADHRRGATWYELAHDRLVRPVQVNNAAWFQANLSALQIQAELWHRAGRPDGMLWSGEALTEAERWAVDHENELTRTETAFLEACREVRRRADQESNEARLMGFLIFQSVVVVLITVGPTAWTALFAPTQDLRNLPFTEIAVLVIQVHVVPFAAYLLGIIVRRLYLPSPSSPRLIPLLLLSVPIYVAVGVPILAALQYHLLSLGYGYLLAVGIIMELGMLVETLVARLDQAIRSTTSPSSQSQGS